MWERSRRPLQLFRFTVRAAAAWLMPERGFGTTVVCIVQQALQYIAFVFRCLCVLVHVNGREEAVGNHARRPGERLLFQVFRKGSGEASFRSHPISSYKLSITLLVHGWSLSHNLSLHLWPKQSQTKKKSMEQGANRPRKGADVIKSVCRVREIKEGKNLWSAGEVPGGIINNIYRWYLFFFFLWCSQQYRMVQRQNPRQTFCQWFRFCRQSSFSFYRWNCNIQYRWKHSVCVMFCCDTSLNQRGFDVAFCCHWSLTSLIRHIWTSQVQEIGFFDKDFLICHIMLL